MNRNTLALLGAVVVLGAIAFFLMQRPGEQSLDSSEGEPLLRIDSASVDRIRIDSPGLPLSMTKRGAEWHIESPLPARASQNAVTTLLHELSSTMIKATVSDRPEKHSLFQVDSTALLLKIFHQENEVGSLFIGKPGPGYGDVYVRPEKTNEVYLVDGAVSRSARQPLKEWRDRTVVSVPRESITEIQYQFGDTTFTVSWKDSVWMIGNQIADEAALSSLLGLLANLQGDEFLDSLPAKSKLIATITFAGIHLRISQAKGSETFTIQSSSSSQLFELQGWRGNQLLKRKKDLLKTSI